MKITLSIFLLLLGISVRTFAQENFEGVVTYTSAYQSHMPNVTDNQIARYFGTTQRFYIKGAESEYLYIDGMWMTASLYVAAEKRVYDLSRKGDSALWYNVTVNHDTIVKTELKSNDTTILGYPCDKLTFICKHGAQIYYFTAKFAVDPDLYADFKEVCYYDFLKISKAVALKTIFILKDFTVTMTAVDVTPMQIDDKIFELPPEVRTAKNPQRP